MTTTPATELVRSRRHAAPGEDHRDNPVPHRTRSGRRGILQALVVVLASSASFVLALGGSFSRMSLPWGGGDLLYAYATVKLWSEGTPFGSTRLGYPFGIEQRYFPTADVLPNLVAGVVTRVSGNPFLGINTVYALSFPVTALAALWVFRVAGMRSWWTVLGSVALTLIPFHWLRQEHVYLATMYSAVLGVGLALLVGNGTVERRLREPGRSRFVVMLVLLSMVVATSGIYYAFFAGLLSGVAWVYRLARGSRWRELLLSLVPAVLLTVTLVLVMAPAILHLRSNPPIDPIVERLPSESLDYAGALALALLPAPVSRLPGAGPVNDWTSNILSSVTGYPLTESVGYSNYGSFATVVAVVVFAVGGLLLARRTARRQAARAASAEDEAAPPARADEPSHTSLGLVALLLGAGLLFFVPFGLNYLFAGLVSADIRAWNRLVPTLFTLLFVGAGLVLQGWDLRLRPVVAGGLVAISAIVLLLDSVVPYRTLLTAATTAGARFGAASQAYAADVNAAVPGDCGVFELPYFPYPEFPHKVDMGNYEPLWPAMTNPEKSWSGGAMKGTVASEWQAALGDDIDARDIPALEAGGFCAVHVDKRGYSDEDAARLTSDLRDLLGAPVATALAGDWVAYALPSPVRNAPDAAGLVEADSGVASFYAPPRITPGSRAPQTPSWTPFETTWWLPEGRAGLAVDSIAGGPAFASLDGSVRVDGCGPRAVTLTLESDESEVSRTVLLEPGPGTDFRLELPETTRNAQLVVTTSTTDCAAEQGEPQDPGVVALVDLRALDRAN